MASVLTVTLHGGPDNGRTIELRGDEAANPPAVLRTGSRGRQAPGEPIAPAHGQYERRDYAGATGYEWVETRSAAIDQTALETSNALDEPRALTIHQPWAHAIIHGKPPKDVENRTWPTGYRGRLYVHASTTDDETAPGAAWAAGNAWHEHAHGAIIGYATLTACTGPAGANTEPSSPWAVPGMFHWWLADPVALPRPLPIRGRQNLWRLPDWAVAALAELEP